jgi:hypothetical protein
VRSEHPPDLAWGDRQVYWYVAEGSSKTFRRVKVNRSKQGSAGATKLSATFEVPAGKFRFFECFSAPGKEALGPAGIHHSCHKGRDFQDDATGKEKQYTASYFFGHGKSPNGFPYPYRVRNAASYLRSRAGYTGFAVMDSEGRLSGQDIHRTFVSASVVKAMLLVAYLSRRGIRGHRLSAASRSVLHPMITRSDNAAASRVFATIGTRGLARLARRAGMHHFAPSYAWGDTRIAAADQARFFYRIDRLVPRRHRGYARGLLRSVVPYQRWGIPRALPRRTRVYFKGGWRPAGSGWIVHQVALLERGRRRMSLAVLTDRDRSEGYGHETIRGIAARLLPVLAER